MSTAVCRRRSGDGLQKHPRQARSRASRSAWWPTQRSASCSPADWIPRWCAPSPRAESEKPIRTFAIGMREDAIDLKYAREAARLHRQRCHTEVHHDARAGAGLRLEDVIRMLGTFDITTIRASMGMYLLCKCDPREHGYPRAAHRRDLRRALRLQIYRFRPVRGGVPEGSARSASASCTCTTCSAPTAASPSTRWRRACPSAIWIL